jgi:chromosomal replication initiator protein
MGEVESKGGGSALEGAAPDQGSAERFSRVLEDVRGRIPKRQFATWFERATLHTWSDGHLVVGLPNRFYQVWFQNKFTELIRDAAEKVSQAPVLVSFEVVEQDEEEAPPPPPTLGTLPPPRTRQTTQQGEGYPAPFAGSGRDDMPLNLNGVYSFDNFIVGPSNSVAHASAKAVAENPGRAYNPLFIHGSVGLGKTHLLHAVCHEFLKRYPQDRVCFLSCEEFTNEFVRSLQHNDVDSFRARFRNVHLLVIDDIHFLKGKERTQEEFFHTFNGLYQSDRQIVLSSDAAPNEIPTLEERLVSRFHWGLVSQLEQPEMETRMAIVRRKAELMGIDLPNDVVEYIATNFRNNIRELEGALLGARAHASVVGSGISLEQTKLALKGNIKPRGAGITLDGITKRVCSEYQVKDADLRSKRRARSVSEPRQVIMYLARQLTKLSLDEIGDYFGGRDHSTVLYAVRKTESRRKIEPALAATIDRLIDRLGGRMEA